MSVLVDKKDGVAKITINRPQVLNALDMETLRELRDALEECEEASDVKVVVLAGAGGRAFTAGADIAVFKEFFSDLSKARSFWKTEGPAVHTFIERMSKPVVAAVQGYCLGGGLEIALACDMVIASRNSRFGFPEVNLGLIPGWGGTQRIARVVGRHRAKELVMLGGMVGAEEAERIGIINKVVPEEELERAVDAVVGQLKEKSPVTLALAKEAVNRAYEVDLVSGMSHETDLDTLLVTTEDVREGVSAFLEKRKPAFKGK